MRKAVFMRRTALVAAVVTISLLASAQDHAPMKASIGPSEVKIGGAVSTPFSVNLNDLKKMPRKTLKVENSHSQKTEVYEGVPIAALLQKAGVAQGEALRGPGMSSYVLVEAADNYRVLFSLAELDSSFQDADVILADTMDGAPLPSGEGPFKVVAPHEKRPGRWVKMVSSITVGHVGN